MAMVGYAYPWLARAAKKVVVDIDEAEIRKTKIPLDLPVVADAGAFIREMLRQTASANTVSRTGWNKRCQEWRLKYPVVLPEHRARKESVSTYVFSEVMSEELGNDAVVVPASAGICVELFLLAFRSKEGQRVFHNRGTGAMGLALPASIAACLASGKKQTVCIDADGGLQMNIQELETIIRLKLPIKIFVLNNGGYASIAASQKRYFGRLVGANASSGLSLPEIRKVAAAYGFETEQIATHADLRQKIRKVLDAKQPVVCEVMMALEETRAPCISSRQLPNGSMTSTPLEDMCPFLDRQEFLSNMIIPPLEGH